MLAMMMEEVLVADLLVLVKSCDHSRVSDDDCSGSGVSEGGCGVNGNEVKLEALAVAMM